MRKSFMKTFVDAQKDYDQLEIYRKWLRDNNVSFQKNRSQKLKYGLCLREKQIPL